MFSQLKFTNAEKCIFVGYDENVKGYRVWNTETNKIQLTRDATFVKEKVITNYDKTEFKEYNYHIDCHNENNNLSPPEEELCESFGIPESINNTLTEDESFHETMNSTLPETNITPTRENVLMKTSWCSLQNENIIENKLRDNRKTTQRRCDCCQDSTSRHKCKETSTAAVDGSVDEPSTYADAITSKDRLHWKQAMDEEYNSLITNKTWILVPEPKNNRIIDNKWVYKVKYLPDGTIDRFKARLVVRGFK